MQRGWRACATKAVVLAMLLAPLPGCVRDTVLTRADLRGAYSRPPSRWPRPEVAPGVAWSELGLLPAPPPAPRDNPSTPAKVKLGQRLFDDPQLSRSGQIACATCHAAAFGWGDGRRVSIGHAGQAGRRNAPAIDMSAYATHLFWDGRAPSLEAQSMQPVADAREMAFTPGEMARRLDDGKLYASDFDEVFGTPRVTPRDVARALAAYERSLRPRESRFDRFLQGDRQALDDRELAGLHLFRTRAGCMNCHSGPTLSDGGFHNLGLHFRGRAREDLGRYEATGDPADSGRFRTPSLRNVALSAPYMHNGLIPQLRGVVLFYNAGGGKPRPHAGQPDALFPTPDPLLKPLGLTNEEVDDLVAFLQAL